MPIMPIADKNRIIPGAPVGRLLMAAGAKRASAGAVQALAEYLEAKGVEIGARAVEMAKHTGRKTVHGEDIKLAARKQ